MAQMSNSQEEKVISNNLSKYIHLWNKKITTKKYQRKYL